ncbi:MAG: peptidoglycan-binding protein, partial [Alteromonadaceae bacterium]|nr:peptidoglycan-binding protein [Alteromonadaceae bacterium]
NGLTKADRKALQKRLTAQGYDTQGADGVIGPDTRAAIRAYQSATGASVTGDPSKALLRNLG